MSDEYYNATRSQEEEEAVAVEATDRGLFGLGKKEKVVEEAEVAAEFGEKVSLSEEPEKKVGFLEKLRRSGSGSSSSSSDEEEAEEGKEKKRKEKKKKTKELKETKYEEEEETKYEEDTSVPVEKYEEPGEKKGCLDKIKEKLPGNKKEEVPPPPLLLTPAAAAGEANYGEGSAKEKKGIFEKIKEKLPGFQPKAGEEKKE